MSRQGEDAMRIGTHVSSAGSFAESARRAHELGCECMQIFAGPPRNYSRPMPSDADAKEFRALVREYDLRPVVVHASYLLHLISAKPATAKASLGLFQRELAVAGALGAEYYVLHPGSVAGRDRAEVIESLVEVMTGVDSAGPVVLIENSANTNTGLGARFEELAAILKALGDPKRFAMAFDTAHATGAGYDVSSSAAVKKTLARLYKCVGRRAVKIVHANDSKAAVGSNRDLHQHIGEGEVGAGGFEALFADRTLGALPFILETPIDEPGDDRRNIDALRRIAQRSADKGRE
jgi:deoxyribonuclease-4